MARTFSQRIAPHVRRELAQGQLARHQGRVDQEFQHLENAHVLGQSSTFWHTRVHVQMLLWSVRQRSLREFAGQCMRVIGAMTKTVFGFIPQGNTGGSNVSAFQVMPVDPRLARLIERACAPSSSDGCA